VIIQLAKIAPGVCWEIEEAFDTVYIGRREGNRRPLLEMCFLSLSYYPEQEPYLHITFHVFVLCRILSISRIVIQCISDMI